MMLETAETKFVEVRGTKYAYRSVGNDVVNLPLVFLQHFTGTIDGWDPLVVNGLAKHRLVIVFDNAGVASSSGTTPDNVAQMAIDAQDFISALGFEKVDLLGYSLGGMVAQQLAADHPDLVRRILLVGTGPRGGEEHLLKVLDDARSQPDLPDPRLDLFFTKSKASRAAGLAFLLAALLHQSVAAQTAQAPAPAPTAQAGPPSPRRCTPAGPHRVRPSSWPSDRFRRPAGPPRSAGRAPSRRG